MSKAKVLIDSLLPGLEKTALWLCLDIAEKVLVSLEATNPLQALHLYIPSRPSNFTKVCFLISPQWGYTFGKGKAQTFR